MQLTFAEIIFQVGLSGLVLLLGILRFRQRGWGYCLAFAMFYFYLLALVGLTLFPIPILEGEESRQTATHILSRVNFIPFNFGHLFELSSGVIRNELTGNILLTIPFGLGFPFLVQIRVRAIPWLALVTGLAIETAQLLISLAIGTVYRSVDINDVLLNSTGVLLGYLFFRVLTRLKIADRVMRNLG